MTLEQAIVTFVLMLVAQIPILVAGVVSYLKSKSAIDINTKITKYQGQAAIKSAEEAKDAAQTINKKLNGGIDPLHEAMKQNSEALAQHAKTDDENMQTINKRLNGIEDLLKAKGTP